MRSFSLNDREMVNMNRNIKSIMKHSTSKEIQHILSIVEELINKNKVISLDKLNNIARRRLDLSSQAIDSIIEFMVKNKIIIEGTKLTKKSVLLNQIRSDIYEFIKKCPGVHFSSIKKNAYDGKEKAGSSSHFIWHLNALLKYGLIKKVEVKNYSVLLPIDMDDEVGICFFLMRDKINRKIIEILLDKEVIQQARLTKEIEASKAVVLYHIKILIQFNMISTSMNKRTNLKEIRPHLEKCGLLSDVLEELNKIESQDVNRRERFICAVHKGPIEGEIYLCPKCHTVYCVNCAGVLKRKNENCWSCDTEIKTPMTDSENPPSASLSSDHDKII